MNEHDFDEGLKQVLVCTYGEDCAAASKAALGSPTAFYDAVKAARNAQGLKRELYVVRTSCQGWCSYAPVCSVLPQGVVLSGLKVQDAEALIEKTRQGRESAWKEHMVWDFSKSRAANEAARAQWRPKAQPE